jgi:preprotein translocase subunit SecA
MSDAAVLSRPRVAVPALRRYPERPESREAFLDRLVTAAGAMLVGRATRRRGKRLEPIVAAVARRGAAIAALDDVALARAARAAGALLKQHPDWPLDAVAQAFAVIREAADRTLGQRHFDVQLIGGYALVRGMIAEMATGEGKTLAATLAAATAGLAGVPVHVVTVNAYLAARDAERMGPLYRFLGLSVGAVTDAISPHERASAYRCDITYCTNKDLAFDYMRDRLRLGRIGNLRRKAASLRGPAAASDQALLRGLHYAIVDEADSVLIDEARTPLVLSGPTDASREEGLFDQALALARDLTLGEDYQIIGNERRVVLLPRGRQALAAKEQLGSPWNEVAERERLVAAALTALCILRPDEQYLVRDGKVEIIDEFTGRVMPDRTWSEDLHEMVERKEGLALSGRRATLARMTYQRFFRRYCRLGGMTGTGREVAEELWRVYRLPVAAIPLHRPDRKVLRPARIHPTAMEKWNAIANEVAAMHAREAPVLIGTRTVAASLEASAALTAAGLPHVVLNAAQDKTEAQIIACAGQCGAITVATNMAGRGTDIELSPEARSLGGLHVMISELHETGRIDRQLAGRCGRQGDPGQVATHISLEDELIEHHCPSLLRTLARAAGTRSSIVGLIARFAQRRAEGLHARMRRDLLKSDEWLGDAIAFAGEQE